MALIACPDCGTQVSDQAPACPKCGRPGNPNAAAKSETGAWCPHCGHRDSRRGVSIGWFAAIIYGIFVLSTMGVGLIFFPFLPRSYRCNRCQHEWKA
jgi:DNA-directed RNA polymerase subunit RPC12/RpoP